MASEERSGDPQSRGGDSWRSDWLFFALLALAAGLRLHNLAANDIWIDEANSILTAQQPIATILDMLKRDSSPPFFYFLLQGWMAVVGDGPAALRLPGVACSLALVAAVYAIGLREHSRRAARWAAFLVAIAPVQIFYAQQVRMYALLPLLALAAWWFLVQYLREGRVRDYWLSIAATAIALYTHNFAVYIALVHIALVLLSGQLVVRLRMWLSAAVLLTAAYAAWIPTLLLQLENQDHYAWFLDRWAREGWLGSIRLTLDSWMPSGSGLMFALARPIDWHGVPVVFAAGFALFGTAVLARRRGELGALGTWWLPVACSLPCVAALALSSIFTPHYVPGRVDQMMFPCFALLCAVGLAAVKPEGLQRGLAPILLVVALIGRGSLYSDYRALRLKGGVAALSEVVVEVIRPGDVILATALTRGPLEYYLQRAGVEASILSFPRETARHLGSQNHTRLMADPAALVREAGIVVERARAGMGPDGRLILLRTNVGVNDALSPESLRSRFGVTSADRHGRYKLSGSKELIWLTVNRFEEP